MSPPAPLLPRALEPGMTVALVAPSSHLFEPERYRIAEEVVRSLGLEPRLAVHATDQRGYLAGTDADRAADLNHAFSDPAIDAVWCLRGGYGALRILPLLDFEKIRSNPKVFLGYSDITALLNAIRQETGLITFHGPVAASNLQPYTIANLRRATMSTFAPCRYARASRWTRRWCSWATASMRPSIAGTITRALT